MLMDFLGQSNYFLLKSFVEIVVEWILSEVPYARRLEFAGCQAGTSPSSQDADAWAGRVLQALAAARAAR